MSRYSLSSEHYAHGWSAGEEYDLKTVNDLGLRYARAPEGVEKGDLLAQLLRHFHPYLMKYLAMIGGGRMPKAGTPAGRDAQEFLFMLCKERTVLPTYAGQRLLAIIPPSRIRFSATWNRH